MTVGDFCLKGKLEKNTSSLQNNCAYEVVGLILQTWKLQLITLKPGWCESIATSDTGWSLETIRVGTYPTNNVFKKSQTQMLKSHVFLDLSCRSLPKICSTQPFHSTLWAPSPVLAVFAHVLATFQYISIPGVHQFAVTLFLVSSLPIHTTKELFLLLTSLGRAQHGKILLSATSPSGVHPHTKGMDNGKWQIGNCLYMAPEKTVPQRKYMLQRAKFS